MSPRCAKAVKALVVKHPKLHGAQCFLVQCAQVGSGSYGAHMILPLLLVIVCRLACAHLPALLPAVQLAQFGRSQWQLDFVWKKNIDLRLICVCGSRSSCRAIRRPVWLLPRSNFAA